MHNNQDVLALIQRLRPLGVCDPCVDATLEAADLTATRRRIHILVGQDGIARKIGKCCLCGTKRTVTQMAA